MKRILTSLLAAALLFSLACAPAASTPDVTDTNPGAPAAETAEAPVDTAAPTESADGVSIADFSVTDLSGNQVDQTYFSDHKLVMVNFWATWCGPCVAEMPAVAKLAKDYADQGFAVLGVQVDEDADGARSVMADSGVEYPVIALAPGTTFYDLSMGMQYIPTTMFFDAEGKQIGDTAVGGNSYDGWKSIVDGYLAQVG